MGPKTGFVNVIWPHLANGGLARLCAGRYEKALQPELFGQQFQVACCQLSRLFPKLLVEAGIIMRIYAALKCFSGSGSVKEAGCDAQCAPPKVGGALLRVQVGLGYARNVGALAPRPAGRSPSCAFAKSSVA
jgi:hypothetical protein